MGFNLGFKGLKTYKKWRRIQHKTHQLSIMPQISIIHKNSAAAKEREICEYFANVASARPVRKAGRKRIYFHKSEKVLLAW